MHAKVSDMRRHFFNGISPTRLQKRLVARRVELQNLGAVLKALSPLGPTPRRVLAFDGKDG